MIKVLVTGGSGFIGSNILQRLVKNKNIILQSVCFKNKINIDHSNKIKNFNCDLRIKKNCKVVTKNIDVVIMCSANSSGAKVMRSNPMEHFNPNIIMNINMLEAAYENKVKKFIFLSSNAIYPVSKRAMKEEDENTIFFEGYFIAAWMKKISEIACEIYSKKLVNKMVTIIVRPGNLYGPRDKFDPLKSKVIPSLIRKIFESSGKLDVWGDGNDIKDFLYIDDFTKAIEKIVFKLNNHCTLNIASGKSVTIKKIIKLIFEITNKKNYKINYQKNQPSMIPVRKIDISLVKKKINWAPSTELKSGLKKTIEWYKKFKIKT